MIIRTMKTHGAIVASILALAVVAPVVVSAQEELLTKTQAFTKSDINVILSPAENDLVSVIVGLEGGVMTGETDNPALGEFATDLITSSATGTLSKEDLRRFVSRTSTQLYGTADLRGVRFILTSTRSHFDEAWNILASMIMSPGYDTLEFRNIMTQRLATARRRWAQPEAWSHILADSLLKLGHPVLGKSVLPENVEAVMIPKLRELMGRITQRTRMLVVVVGNVSPTELKKKLEVFEPLPRGSYRQQIVQDLPVRQQPDFVVVDRPGAPTTYVTAGFVGPNVRSGDYWPLQVGMSFLREKLFDEVRTKRNLSYAPQSYLISTLGQGTGYLSVSSVNPDSAISVMYRELEKMRRGDFDAKELEDAKQVFITGFYMGRNTNSDKASAVFMAQRNAGDWRRAFNFEAIEKVTKADVQRAFQRWAIPMEVGIIGPAAAVNRDRYRYSVPFNR